MTTEKAHAKLSASSSDRWMNCSGSIALIDKAPPPRESAYAKEGTTAHECMEKLLKGEGSRQDLIKQYGQDVVDCVDYMDGAVNERVIGHETILVEERIKFPLTDHEGNEMFGTVDCAIVDENARLVIIDYKHGQGVAVFPEKNLQMIYYAIGLAEKYKWNFKDVELVIVQPRAFTPDGDVVRSWVLTIDELKSYVVLFKKGIERVKSKPRLYAGDHCKFCAGSVICPEQTTRSLEAAQIAFSEPLEAMTAKLPAPNDLTPEQVSIILQKATALEAFVKSVGEYAEDYMKRGLEIPGFKLVAKRGSRIWGDETALEKALKRHPEWNKQARTEPKFLSPAQMEKVTGKDFVAKYTVSVSSGTTLAPESDKRPAVNLIENAFNEPLTENKESESSNGKKESKKVGDKVGDGVKKISAKEKSPRKKSGGKKETSQESDVENCGF